MSTATTPPAARPAASPAAPAGPRRWRRPGRSRRNRTSRLLTGLSLAVAAVMAVPLAFLVFMSAHVGGATLGRLLWRRLTLTLLWNTVELSVVVAALCAVVGVAAAWCVERTDLPGRRMWAVLVVVPLAIPDFVVSFGWASVSPWVVGFRGAVLVMTLALYPLVYLPVSASLRGADPAQEEMSRSLGVGPVRTFVRVTLGQARGAVLGGCLLVTLVMLAEYGAFEILGYQTFTTEIFTEFQTVFDPAAASSLSLVLVLLSVVVLAGDALARGSGRVVRSGPQAQRVARRHRLGRATAPVLAGFSVLAALALGVPVGTSVYWMLEGAHTLQAASLLSATLTTAAFSAAAALVATMAAVPVALLAVRHPRRTSWLLERSTLLVLAMPGLVIALALSYVLERYADGVLYQSPLLLVIAYSILFFPLALVCVRASVVQAPTRLEEVARSLGRGRLAVLVRVTLPLVAPGLAAAFCLVFLSAVTELTATLVLIPTGMATLATQFWFYQQYLSYGQAAPFALVIIAIAVLPSYVLGRWFDRLPARREVAA